MCDDEIRMVMKSIEIKLLENKNELFYDTIK